MFEYYFYKKSIQQNIHSVLFTQGNLALAEQLWAERDEAEQKAERWQYGKVAVDALGKALSTSSGGTTGQVVSVLSPAGAYAIGQYFKNNDAKNRQDGGTRAGEGSTPHLIAHGLLSAAVSYATGERPETITASTITTMGAEKLVQPVASYLFGKGKAEDLSAEEKQTISNVLGAVGLVVGAVTAQSNDADSYTTATSAVNVQSDVQNAVDNNGVFDKLGSKFGKVSSDVYQATRDEVIPRNSALAGSVHPKTNVPFDNQGYPDFSAHIYRHNGKSTDVNIGSLTGDRRKDEQLACCSWI